MWAELKPVWVIARREVRDQFRDWRIVIPILLLTVFFPALMNFTAQQMLGFVAQYGADIIAERLIPFLLMIVGFFPISVSLVIALESFVGEKERGSIEPLLSTPLKDWQLYLGKLVSSTIPPLLGSFLGMTVYLSGLAIKGITLPEGSLIFQIFVLTIVQAIVMVSGAVVVSSQATSVRATNLLASFIVIPVALLIQGESMVMFWGRETLSLWWIVAGLAVLSVLLVRAGLAHFQREELLGREIDVLHLRQGWIIFRQSFSGGASSINEWLFLQVPRAIREMGWSILAMTIFTAISLFLGAAQTRVFTITLPTGSFEEGVRNVVNFLPGMSAAPALLIVWQNVRSMIIGLLLGIFSFGILGVLPVFITMGVVGYLIQTLANNSIPTIETIPALILPHGIFEIPAIILATAAVIHLGALLVTPLRARTVGEVFLTGLGRWARVMLGIVIPLFCIAAVIEIYITPLIAVKLLP